MVIVPTVGFILSIVISLLALVFLFPAISVHTLFGICTVCVQVPSFVTTSVYMFSLLLNVPFIPFVTVTSSFVNSITSSLNVNVYVIVLAFVGLSLSAVIVHVGFFIS